MHVRTAERYIILASFAFAGFGCDTTPALPPTRLSAAALVSDILGRWYQKTFKEMPDYRFEIWYHADGTVSARRFDSALQPDGTPTVWHHDYAGTWRLSGATIAHHWTSGLTLHDPGPDLRECRITALSPAYMELQDTTLANILEFHRKPTLTE